MDPTYREIGKLEEGVRLLHQDIAEMRGEFRSRLGELKDDFRLTSSKQGERIGDLETTTTMFRVERRFLFAGLLLAQSFALAVFGAWIKGIF